MNQKTASEVFELNDTIVKEQSDKFNNEYKDSVEGISRLAAGTMNFTFDLI
ncbi:uncharacterized protein BDCG_17698 [Blastomyces dermatitidis ER-3]|uniref:Uncharacterized protein n=1 Tax=Ajellomyces dermatitidis (strain ER-3 / ATCC MYA-2586) TaxID=559297 RepID=A0ABX2VZT5_AJEDR|nr:uncharacterized protein BDCG_17698 [Blastomyces dermatitidis ER-3]OAT02650.1 hypothetical protein BDCG_17698 [Blastomyces dermatitidis ER-3]